MLPRQELLRGASDPAALEPLVAAAEETLRTWQPVWTPFLSAARREQAEECLAGLSELRLHSEGGYPGAERRRLMLQRADSWGEPAAAATLLSGLEVRGNFLFDPAEPADVRAALVAAGAADGELGDIWMRGDRGAQAIVTSPLAGRLDQGHAQVRSVAVDLVARPLAELQLPAPRASRRFTSVEASLRLDALASAGFGLSRGRMAALIRQGAVRLNWRPIANPSQQLVAGDRVQLESRGELVLEEAGLTRRDRWRVTLLRR
jgi:photosystem II S4 domain protein